MKKILIGIFALFFAAALFCNTAEAGKRKDPEVKYVFYMVGDGMSINLLYGTELYNRATGKGPENLNILQFPVRTMVTTYSTSSLVTDSGAAGTALACGRNTDMGFLGVDPEGKRMSNITEWAKAMGYGTGIATSVGINHATPSAFYAHQESRYQFAEIIGDYISSGLDFLAGAGIYTDRRKGPDAEVLERKITESGITVLRGGEIGRSGETEGRLLCMSGKKQKELRFAIDQEEDDTNLSDFVSAGIDYLDRHYSDKGFILIVEGGKIDYANHSNDAVTAFHEMNDFAAVIDLALEFYKEHPEETLIVVSADHETGGMLLGAGEYRMDPDLLAWQTSSEDVLSKRFCREFSEKAPTWDEAKAFLSENLGLWSHVKVDEEFEGRLKAEVEKMALSGKISQVNDIYSENTQLIYDAVTYLARAAGFDWAHMSHSGSPVGLFVLGPGAESFNACRDNSDIPKKIAEAAGYEIF